MTVNEIIGAIVLAILGGAGGGTWAIIAEANRLRDRINLHDTKIAQMEEDCRTCKKEVKRQLQLGESEFKKLNNDVNETQMDVLNTVKVVAEENGKYREKVHEQFVSEATFKERVIGIMMTHCPNCGKR